MVFSILSLITWIPAIDLSSGTISPCSDYADTVLRSDSVVISALRFDHQRQQVDFLNSFEPLMNFLGDHSK
jgi:hypothetical protein